MIIRPVRLVIAGGVIALAATPALASTPMPLDPMPTPEQQQAAIDRVAKVGVPIYRAGNQKRYVALTFDDGPGPYTVKVMNEMRKYGFRATFFTNGKNLDKWQDTLKREASQQALGDHTWSHHYLPGLSTGAQIQEVSRSVTRSEQITHKAVRLFRPPYGAGTNAVSDWVNQHNMVQVMWTQDSRDSLGAPWTEILSRSAQYITPGSIILLHENRGQTIKAVNRLLPESRGGGFKAVTRPVLLALNPPSEAQLRSDAGGRAGTRTGKY
jgi:peptidoglycan/xylan/chitin deacetylase (PgdA/CDA1 family)